ncbi:MAG TPA: PepSY-associated TM helix domain-containing protein [Verrucomicrobiae bacterium]|nr:PepSY-associated TM helix domain-containing protein [Verrucomicrobiae bacterium]
MLRRLYTLTRDLHLYLGLFISPFVLLFSVTVFFFVHAIAPKLGPETTQTRAATNISLPDLSKLSGRALIDALKPTLSSINVPGEIGFIRHVVSDDTFVIPVSVPGRATTVTIRVAQREATIVTRETGLADAMMTLHRSPGEHSPTLSRNWFPMRAWRWLSDTTAYLTLFITISGLYLWFVLRSERRIGYVLLATGALLFFGLAYVVAR